MEETAEPVKKARGWPKGKPRKAAVAAPAILPAPEPEGPIHVRVTRKGMDPFEFFCGQHFTENGFHVFIYPSHRDRYRQTRREIAISEIIDIEITEARPVENRFVPTFSSIEAVQQAAPPEPSQGPRIHSARQSMMGRRQPSIVEQLETSDGPIKMDRPPVTFGDSAG